MNRISHGSGSSAPERSLFPRQWPARFDVLFRHGRSGITRKRSSFNREIRRDDGNLAADMGWPTRTRWKIGALLCAAALVNYFLRVNISIAGDPIMRQFQLSQTQLGTIFSAFLLGYTLFQIPGGLLADRLGPRLILAAAAVMWGTLTFLTGLGEWLSAALGVHVITVLIALRFLLGVSQAPMFPASGTVVARWFPARERAAGNGLAITGICVGSCLAPPLVSWMMGSLTWQRS